MENNQYTRVGAAIDPAIEHIVVRAADSERVRSDTASVIERADGSLLVAYHSYSLGPEGGGDFGAAKIYLAESEDGGRHWSNEHMVADIVAGDLNVMSPFLCQMGDEILDCLSRFCDAMSHYGQVGHFLSASSSRSTSARASCCVELEDSLDAGFPEAHRSSAKAAAAASQSVPSQSYLWPLAS